MKMKISKKKNWNLSLKFVLLVLNVLVNFRGVMLFYILNVLVIICVWLEVDMFFLVDR